ncbi:MAG: DUF3800 domain-containing protein [Planctomycetes bacterium]|nr:DUF3800 domain-containing protein [Planctomycetota bacterium]
MKFCYADESLDDKGKLVQVMVGIVADAHRLNRSRQEFAEIFGLVSGVYPEALRELKGSRIFYGRGAWRKVPPDIRKAVFRLFCDWVTERKHCLAMSAIDIDRFNAGLPAACPKELRDLWVAGAVHIALQLQKLHQPLPKNKGHTVLIFDENKFKGDKLNEVLFAPPVWTKPYYEKKAKQEPLDQIIDSAFFTKSHHTGLVQVADLFAFVFRRYAELTDYGVKPAYKDEPSDIQGLVDRLKPRLIRKSYRWPPRTKGECAQTYVNLAPARLAAI